MREALLAHATKLGSDASGDLRLWEIDAHSALSESWQQPRGLAQPIEFEGGLTLIGYDLRAAKGRPIDLVTYWRVEQAPAQPLSIFAHIADAAGNIVAQGDGTQDDLVRPENGWRVSPGDADALLETLQKALSDAPRLRRMGRESFRIVAEEANIEHMVSVFIQAVNTVMDLKLTG